jgi:hypothetical protein
MKVFGKRVALVLVVLFLGIPCGIIRGLTEVWDDFADMWENPDTWEVL